ncbi:MAG: hypothetical protein Q8M09_10280 [Pseudomonadota bacterium]|nr:hypothetical protein [Pseudomonadota bacterium]MDP1904615.1 hypothetical protein [Pseudomonadota bacterium]MDP2353260.1 hypothetical protein [Pseudomonadota bacterium]
MKKLDKAASAAGSLYKKNRKPMSREEEKAAIGAMLKARDEATKPNQKAISHESDANSLQAARG